jgi:hypothetical protein
VSATPTARTLVRLRADGWLASVVERWNAHARIRQDLFGFIDVLAIRPGSPPLAVQATTTKNQAARLAKALALPELRTWLAAGCAFEVWGWSKKGPRGRRKLWEVTRRVVTLKDLRGRKTGATTSALGGPDGTKNGQLRDCR